MNLTVLKLKTSSFGQCGAYFYILFKNGSNVLVGLENKPQYMDICCLVFLCKDSYQIQNFWKFNVVDMNGNMYNIYDISL